MIAKEVCMIKERIRLTSEDRDRFTNEFFDSSFAVYADKKIADLHHELNGLMRTTRIFNLKPENIMLLSDNLLTMYELHQIVEMRVNPLRP